MTTTQKAAEAARYRKKPVVIEAWQVNTNLGSMPGWLVGRPDLRTNGGLTPFYVKTLEGVMQADLGDWIIKGVKGEIYPCKPNIFAEIYEPLSLPSARVGEVEPIPMVLHCPVCGAQHIDAPNPERSWANPPHRSHECQKCGTIWRPADVATTGVAIVATKGTVDTWTPWAALSHPDAALSPEGRPRKMNGLLLRLRTARLNGLFDASKALKMKDDGDSVSAILDAVEAALTSPEGWGQGGEWRTITDADVGQTMLVTNNINARNAFGEMSHVWITWIQAASDPENTGKYVGFDCGDRLLHNLSHCVPIPTPPSPKEGCQHDYDAEDDKGWRCKKCGHQT